MSHTLRIAGIEPQSIVDGPGFRYVIFVQGCPHGCAGCHNPQTHDFAAGQEVEIDTLLAQAQQNPLLAGLTFSGGEPFCQAEPLYRLAEKARQAGLDCMAYTGYTIEQLLARQDDFTVPLLQTLSLLIDGRFEMAERDLSLAFRGSRNQRIIDVPRTLAQGRVCPAEGYD